jgi:predicted GNAT family acetyltransferase
MNIRHLTKSDSFYLNKCYNLASRDFFDHIVLLGDLFPPCFQITDVYGIFEKNSLVSFFTVFNGFEIPSIVLLNSAEEIVAYILSKLANFISEHFVLVSASLSEKTVKKYFRITEISSEFCMMTDINAAKFLESDTTLIHGSRKELNRIDNFYRQNKTFPWNPIQLESQFYFLKEKNSDIIACGGTHFETPELAHLGNIFVLPEYRGKSIGKNLVSTIGNKILETKQLISLFVVRDNYPALSLYKKLGFSKRKSYSLYECSVD